MKFALWYNDIASKWHKKKNIDLTLASASMLFPA